MMISGAPLRSRALVRERAEEARERVVDLDGVVDVVIGGSVGRGEEWAFSDIESGLVARCTPTDLEAGFSSPSPSAHAATRRERSAWPFVAMNQPVLDRAVEVQDALAAQSRQRGAKIADLLIAAAAEAAGLVVLHFDHDFDLIAEITRQPVEWIVPAGSVS